MNGDFSKLNCDILVMYFDE